MEKENILIKLNNRTIANDLGCKIWTGKINDKGAPHMQNEYGMTVTTGKWLWNYTFPDDEIDVFSGFDNTCKNKLCVSIEHALKVLRKKDIDYDKIWQRLIANATKDEITGCWLALTVDKEKGYGRSSVAGQSLDSHLASMMVKMQITKLPKTNEKGEILQVAHQCSNRNCFEPSHLIMKTISQNNFEDKIASGTLLRGEKHYNSSISEETASLIKLSKGVDKKTQKQRAAEFGVTLHIVKSIDCCKSWAFLPDANGMISTVRKEKSALRRKKATSKEWNDTDWNNAQDAIIDYKVLDYDNKFVRSPCHEWLGALNGKYGRVTINGTQLFVHVLSNELKTRKRKTKGLVVRHLCGYHKCLNPDHLLEGTARENALDSLLHGTGTNKLQPSDIIDIRESKKTHVELAGMYEVSIGTIASVRKGRTWKHVYYDQE